MPPCLTLSIIRYGSRVKWSNPGKGVAPFPTHWCSKLSKREPSGHPRLWSPTLLTTLHQFGTNNFLILSIRHSQSIYLSIYLCSYLSIYLSISVCWYLSGGVHQQRHPSQWVRNMVMLLHSLPNYCPSEK